MYKYTRKVKKNKNKNKKNLRKYTMKNIYGKKLQPCRINNLDNNGSWDDDGYCNELDGGVHQICFKIDENSKDFSKHTFQSNWSNNRINNNHCMCLGAWSLYKARQNKNQISKTNNELKCDAIPEIALTKEYISKWNKWNGYEHNDQIIDGINALVKQCKNVENINEKKYLLDKIKILKKYYPNIII